MGYLKELLPKTLQYRLAAKGLASPGVPFNLTFSVTNICQSRCRTCLIWDLYKKNPEKRKEELTISEIESVFRSVGHVYILNISGGEPFLRPDFVSIIEMGIKYLTPGIIHIPTNAIAVDLVEKKIKKILDLIRKNAPETRLTIKPSLDHKGERHDEIRGVKGNFKKVMDLFQRLKALKSDDLDYHVELGTVISKWNVKDVEEISRFAMSLSPDSYRNEIAEQRSEMFNKEESITPDADRYEKAVAFFTANIRSHMKDLPAFQRITNAFRLVYYDLAIRIMKENRQVIPCYAGISNAHLTPYGDVWACCTLGYEKSMGNIRDHNLDFHSVWKSPRAKEVRAFIRGGNCACPLANQTYSNILLHGPSVLRVFREIASTR